MNLLIDGSSLLHRAYHIGRKRQLITSYERDVSDVMIFLNTLRSYVRQFQPRAIYVAWDKKLNYPCTNFRQKNVEYKANRDKSLAKDVYQNEEDLISALNALGVKNMYPWTMEADDVIAWLSTKLEGPNVVITADKDMLQLISTSTTYFHPSKKIIIDLNNFKQETSVSKEAFLYYKAILGDVSDNIIGIKGYGKVKAARLAEKISTCSCTKDDQLNPEDKEILKENIKLMDLSLGYKLAGEKEVESYKEQLQSLNNTEPNIDEFISICEQLEFKQFIAKADEWQNLFGESRLFSILNGMFPSK